METTAEWEIPSDLVMVGKTRELTDETLTKWGFTSPDLVDTAKLLVSELITNAIKYGKEPVIFTLKAVGNMVAASVFDSNPAIPEQRDALPDDENGRGLFLVDCFATRSGVIRGRGGKACWFELDAA